MRPARETYCIDATPLLEARQDGSQEKEGQVFTAEQSPPRVLQVLHCFVGCHDAVEFSVHIRGASSPFQDNAGLLCASPLDEIVWSLWQEQPTCKCEDLAVSRHQEGRVLHSIHLEASSTQRAAVIALLSRS